MCKDTTKKQCEQEKSLFSLESPFPEKKIRVDFDAPDISSNGGLLLMDRSSGNFLRKLAALIPDHRNQDLIVHTYAEMVCQRVGQIMCGYEDANDCDRLRGDSALKLSVGRRPSDTDLASQPTMTRLENHVGTMTLFRIAKLFVDQYVASFARPPKKVILDADDTNANTYGGQQLSLFNSYYAEYCYMPLLIFDGHSGRLILPILRPGRRSKSVELYGLMRHLIEYLHRRWPRTVFELRGDAHFCSGEFMDWAHGKWYVRYTTGLAGNPVLYAMVSKHIRRAENDYAREVARRGPQGKGDVLVRRYYKLEYKAGSWEHSQRVAVKIEVSSMGTNVRFVVTSNRNNTPQTVYRRYCHRGQMELWIKDLKYFKADRMSCSSFRANCFRLYLHAAAYVMAFDIKHGCLKGTQAENFTMDSFIKRIMLSAVHIVEKKTFIKVSFASHHRHRSDIELALMRLAG